MPAVSWRDRVEEFIRESLNQQYVSRACATENTPSMEADPWNVAMATAGRLQLGESVVSALEAIFFEHWTAIRRITRILFSL